MFKLSPSEPERIWEPRKKHLKHVHNHPRFLPFLLRVFFNLFSTWISGQTHSRPASTAEDLHQSEVQEINRLSILEGTAPFGAWISFVASLRSEPFKTLPYIGYCMVEGFLKRKSGSSRRNCRLVQLEIVVKSSGASMGFSHQPPSNFMADFENPVTSCVANPQKNLPRNMKDFSEKAKYKDSAREFALSRKLTGASCFRSRWQIQSLVSKQGLESATTTCSWITLMHSQTINLDEKLLPQSAAVFEARSHRSYRNPVGFHYDVMMVIPSRPRSVNQVDSYEP